MSIRFLEGRQRLRMSIILFFILISTGVALSLPPYGLDAPDAIGSFLNGTFPSMSPQPGTAQPPALLSETGAFKDLVTLEPADGLIPYDLNVPFWSDGARKTRWIAIPNDGTHDTPEEQVIFNSVGRWIYPTGTVAIKHFELPVNYQDATQARRLETRFLVYGEDAFYGVTYRWNEEGTEATLLEGSLSESVAVRTPAGIRLQTWLYPDREQCLFCHNQSGGTVLGPQTRQLNGELLYEKTGRTANQLATWNHLGIFSNPIDENELPTFITSTPTAQTDSSLDVRARSYIDSNCAYCHRPGGVFTAYFDARLTTPLENSGMINGFAFNNLGILGGVIIAPGDTSKSLIYQRAHSVKPLVAMPPVAKARIDSAGTALIAEWILSMSLRIVQVTPDSAMQGETVLITGNLFQDATEVLFNGAASAFTIDSNEQITAIVPEDATTGFIEVVIPDDRTLSSTPFTVIPVDRTAIETPLHQDHKSLVVFPNPFQRRAAVRYFNITPGWVKLVLYNSDGRQVRVLHNGFQHRGEQELYFVSDGLASGTYFLRLESPDGVKTTSVSLVR